MKKRNQFYILQKQLSNTKGFNSNKESLKNIGKALNYVHKNGLVSLKSVYNNLFQKIIVQPLDGSEIQLEFVFKEDPSKSRMYEVFYCPTVDMVEVTGVEPATF